MPWACAYATLESLLYTTPHLAAWWELGWLDGPYPLHRASVAFDTPKPDPDTNSTFLLAYLTLTSITHIVHQAVHRVGLRLNPTPGPALSNPNHTTMQARALKLKRTVHVKVLG